MAVALPNGEVSLDIEGRLQDIINNFNTLIANLQAQGIDQSFLKTANVTIHAAIPNVPAATFNNLENAIAAWRATIAATSIVVTTRFAVQG